MKITIPPAQRPATKHYGIADDTDGLLAWSWVRDQMTQSRNYWVCSTRPDGRPHAAPVWGVVLDDVIYFGSNRLSRKGKNLAADPRVVVHLESGDDCVIVEGAVVEITDDALLAQIATTYGDKYPHTPEPGKDSNEVYYGVRPHVVLAWKEYDFPASATRWVFASPQAQSE